MSYTIDQVKAGVASFLDKNLIPLLPEKSWKRVVYGAAIGMYINKADQYVPALMQSPVLKPLGIFREDGTIDLDAAMPYVKQQIGTDGFDVDIPGLGAITFKEADIQTLYNEIKSAK